MPGKGAMVDHRSAWRRHEGIGAGRALAGAHHERWISESIPISFRIVRSPHPRSGWRSAKGRSIRRRRDDDRTDLAPDRSAGARRRCDDRRDHVARSGAAGWRHQGEVVGGAQNWRHHLHHAAPQRGRSGRSASRPGRAPEVRARRSDRGRNSDCAPGCGRENDHADQNSHTWRQSRPSSLQTGNGVGSNPDAVCCFRNLC